MFRRKLGLLILLIILPLVFVIQMPGATAAPLAVIKVTGEIDESQAALVQRTLRDAQQQQAVAVLVEIDTFGGLVNPAVRIRDMLLDSAVPTICYVKYRAWSAGALIALANQHIAVAPGGSIGAAEPIPATEKTVAALRAEFAATAGRWERNPRIAEAMVDKSLGLPGYAEPGQILALTGSQARDLDYADTVAPERSEVVSFYGLAPDRIEEYSLSAQDRTIGFLAKEVVRAVLLIILFFGLLVEIKTAGTGIGAGIGLLAAVLFFGSEWFTGVTGWIDTLLFIIGLAFLILELHTPGTFIFGTVGAAFVFGSLFLALGGNSGALNILSLSIVIAGVLFGIIAGRLPASRWWAKIVLADTENSKAGFLSARNYSHYIGKYGMAVTALRPSGIVEVEGEKLDVVTEGLFITQGVKVKVVMVSGSRVVVRLAENNVRE